MINSIIKDYDRITVFIQHETQRRFYIADVYAVVFPDRNEFSLFAADTNALLYEHLKAVDFIAPMGTAEQILVQLGIRYTVDNGLVHFDLCTATQSDSYPSRIEQFKDNLNYYLEKKAVGTNVVETATLLEF